MHALSRLTLLVGWITLGLSTGCVTGPDGRPALDPRARDAILCATLQVAQAGAALASAIAADGVPADNSGWTKLGARLAATHGPAAARCAVAQLLAQVELGQIGGTGGPAILRPAGFALPSGAGMSASAGGSVPAMGSFGAVNTTGTRDLAAGLRYLNDHPGDWVR